MLAGDRRCSPHGPLGVLAARATWGDGAHGIIRRTRFDFGSVFGVECRYIEDEIEGLDSRNTFGRGKEFFE